MSVKFKRFSFVETLKGNPKIKQELMSWNIKNIDPEINSDPLLSKLPKELKSWLTFLYEYIPLKDIMVGNKRLMISSYDNVVNQFEEKPLFSYNSVFRKIPEKRVILAYLDTGQDYDIIAYYPAIGKLKLTNEAARFDLIGRAVHKSVNFLFKSSDNKSEHPVSDLFGLVKANI